MNAVGSATVGTTATVPEFRHKVITVSAPANTTLTFKFQTSSGISVSNDTEPAFSATRSSTNMWDYIGVYDLEDGTFIDGDTGISLNNDSEENNTRRYLINDDHCRYLNIQISSFTDGSLSAVGSFAND